ncbi:MAG: GntR family transcriptional regulator [Alphaproteobacteria bacterium HGW-Alphaproteobacteria-2]|nr:MAG: GntR family transcriptional regulator [Alphaproteobacteria bacterium HGW-Alphaproteobacteria-2]
MSGALRGLSRVERPATLADRAREELRAAVMAGQFEPGAKLTVRSVARALGVSLTPAREALYGLVSEGALETGANGTTSIPVLTEARVQELLVIRCALEGAAARAAAERITEAGLAELRACDAALQAAHRKGAFKELMALNWQFHFAIYAAADMPLLVRMIEGCWLMTGSYLNVIYPEYGQADHGLANHAAIVAAMEARDGDRLAAAIRTDIEMASRALLAVIAGRAAAEGA